MKKLSLLIVMLLAVMVLPAQSNKNKKQDSRPKVGVVLSGGGAKGAAHIGVLKYLEEMGIPVDYVAGTSMGSIIGGLYSLGYEPDEMKMLISEMHWDELIGNKINRNYMSKDVRDRRSTYLVNIPFGGDAALIREFNSNLALGLLPSAYVNNSSLINLFNDLCIGYQDNMNFNDLPIPFACVATDIVTGQEVVLRSGNVAAAMRSSMAIPGVFAPVEMGNYVLVDGGLVNNFPADVLREMGADIIIGVEVSTENQVTANDLKSLPQVMTRILGNGTSAKRKENRALCNVHIVPDVGSYGMLSFTPDAIENLVNAGYAEAEASHDELLAIKERIDKAAGHPVGKELHAPCAKDLVVEKVFVDDINIEGISDNDTKWMLRKSGLKKDSFYGRSDIDRAVDIFRGTGCFDEVTYTVKKDEATAANMNVSEAYDLDIKMKRAAPHYLGLGFRFDTEEGAAVLLGLGLNAKKFSGFKFGLSGKLSYNPQLKIIGTYSSPSLANFNLSAGYRDEHFRTRNNITNKYVNLRYCQVNANAYISEFHLLNITTSVGAKFNYTIFDNSSFTDTSIDSVLYANNTTIAPFITFQYDNLDDPYFAKHGIMSSLNTHYNFVLAPSDKEKVFDISYAFQAYITPRDRKFTIIPQVYGRYVTNTNYYNLMNVCGGEIAGRHFDSQMPFIGLTSVEDGSMTNNASILRCDLRYNFYGRHYVTAMYNASMPWGVIGHGGAAFVDMFNFVAQGAGLKYSYNSVLGPISLTAHWCNYSQHNSFGVYFSFGYTF